VPSTKDGIATVNLSIKSTGCQDVRKVGIIWALFNVDFDFEADIMNKLICPVVKF